MSDKVILVLLDGLNYQVAHDCMGFTMGLIEHNYGSLYKLQCELPSMSRPLYECVLTGLSPVISNVVCNAYNKRSPNTSIFSLCKEHGLTTAASAYYWVSELYNNAPFDNVRDRIVNNNDLNIQHGIFYKWDHYPDEAVYIDAEFLRQQYDPDFLLVHPMNIDDAGHRGGYDSAVYRNAARTNDTYLSTYLKTWIDLGYQVIVTADHGMNLDNSHSGVLACEREIPLFVFGNVFTHCPKVSNLKQTMLCGTICNILGIKNHKKDICAELIHEN